METALFCALFMLGVMMIIKGSDWFIDSSVWFASVSGIPRIIIGATLVSLCTTLPETFVSATAALRAETDVSVGNALGSIAFNTGFVMALLLVLTAPTLEDQKTYLKNGFFLIAVMLFVWLGGFVFGQIGFYSGIFLLLLLFIYLTKNFLSAKKSIASKYSGEKRTAPAFSGSEFLKQALLFLLGITFVIIGSRLIVDNGISIANALGVPTILIAVIFTAVGTSLPELMTAVASIKKDAESLSIGNILGANLLNMLQVIPTSALIKPISLRNDMSILFIEFPISILMIFAALSFGLFQKKQFYRWNGYALFLLYFVFAAANIMREHTPVLGHLFR